MSIQIGVDANGQALRFRDLDVYYQEPLTERFAIHPLVKERHQPRRLGRLPFATGETSMTGSLIPRSARTKHCRDTQTPVKAAQGRFLKEIPVEPARPRSTPIEKGRRQSGDLVWVHPDNCAAMPVDACGFDAYA